ncbi:MAG: DUF1624 domain-containing protein [Eubacterium sp.]|nr:DUF1624 domain-containing protein [Eubacterium sp.]
MFSKEKINTGRQIELDLAKCMSIVFMIFLHSLMVTEGFANDINPHISQAIAHLLGGPFAAPVFMFSMGFGIVYSRNQAPSYLIKRGFKQLLLGIVVNVGEFFVPYFLSGKLLDRWDIFPIAGGLLLFCVDILAFAGMAMILIGIFKALKLSAWQMVAIALVMSVAGSFLRFFDFGSDIPNLIAGYFIGSVGGFTAFPLFNWILIPAAGILFAEYYSRCENKKKLLCLWPVALIIANAYFVASWYIPNGFLTDYRHYYFMTTLDVVFCLINIYGVIGLWHLVSRFLSEGAVKFVSKMSSNVDVIYIIQWYLIPITYILICYFYRDIVFGDISLFIIAISEIIVCAIIANIYKSIKKKIKKGKSREKKN